MLTHLIFFLVLLGERPSTVHLHLNITLEPQTHLLTAEATLPFVAQGETLEFSLASALVVTPQTGLEPLPSPVREEGFDSINSAVVDPTDSPVTTQKYLWQGNNSTPIIRYSGPLFDPLSSLGAEYTRGFRDSKGQIGPDGVYLAGISHWYPTIDDVLYTFEIQARVPRNWHVISQGDGFSQDENGFAQWKSDQPMDEIYLVGGPLIRYEKQAPQVMAQVFLRQKDAALANKYLEKTIQIIQMYSKQLGPYPYSKFALVENFWETGFGMPGFTLLGSKIIRFPFILTSSYPHEILHNWWGNSVFVSFEEGNWCEGLTAYGADHLYKEFIRQDHLYRRDTLQKFASYVQDGLDFPLRDFKSRHSASTESVGYGKSMMLFHQLRQQIGDEAFQKGLRAFYRDFTGQRASFSDLEHTFAQTAQQDLSSFFSQWLTRPGAPSLALSEVRWEPGIQEGGTIEGIILQTQEEESFELSVPLLLQYEHEVVSHTLTLKERTTAFSLHAPSKPLALHLDPLFDVFRRVHPLEVPSTIGQLFGQEQVQVILPASLDAPKKAAYEQLIASWQSPEHRLVLSMDRDVATLPQEGNVWILDQSNLHFPTWLKSHSLVTKGESGLTIDQRPLPAGASSWILTQRAENLQGTTGLIHLAQAESAEALARKLPHYGKYSYLAFEGREANNTLKGQWPVRNSPLVHRFMEGSSSNQPQGELPLPNRAPLTTLPPIFSETAMMKDIEALADPSLGGRQVGTPGFDQAAELVERRFNALKLKPLPGAKSFHQTFAMKGPEGNTVDHYNLVGFLASDKGDHPQALIIGAHLDHLGLGWPDVRSGSAGKIHPGADDNASGVGVLMELARVYRERFPEGKDLNKHLVFVAFGGEEAGRIGSSFFVSQLKGLQSALGTPFAAIILDTVGRLNDRPIQVLSVGHNKEWPHIFRGVGFVTGIPIQPVSGLEEASDQKSFIDYSIPAVQLFSGTHEDYHSPEDTLEKIDAAGLVAVATVAAECIDYLLERKEPLTWTGQTTHSEPVQEGKRVRFGSVPDFAFAGPGIRFAEIQEGSPAALAGLKAGDLLTHLKGIEVLDLRHFSQLLKTLNAGDVVEVLVIRDDTPISAQVHVTDR